MLKLTLYTTIDKTTTFTFTLSKQMVGITAMGKPKQLIYFEDGRMILNEEALDIVSRITNEVDVVGILGKHL